MKRKIPAPNKTRDNKKIGKKTANLSAKDFRGLAAIVSITSSNKLSLIGAA
jgi:hypothetical protein